MSNDALLNDLAELLRLLEMGDHARPQSPHAVFQEALAVLRVRLSDEWMPTHRHVKRGSTYQLVGHARLQASTGPAADDVYLALYKGQDGSMWARPAREFLDGRFEALRPAAQTTETEANDGR